MWAWFKKVFIGEFNKIEERNNSDIKYDAGVKPDDKKLQEGEKGVK